MDDFNVADNFSYKAKMFSEKTSDTDITICFNEERIYVPRVILSIASPVFKVMFDSDFQERENGTVNMHDKTCEEFVEFLECLYPNSLKPVTEANVYAILPLAHEYQVDILTLRCLDVLLGLVNESTTADQVYRHMMLADKHGLKTLEEKCKYLASEFNLSDVSEHEVKYGVPDKFVLEIRHLMIKRFELEKEDSKCIHKSIQNNGDVGSRIKQLLNSEEGFYRYSLNSKIPSAGEQNRETLMALRLSYKCDRSDLKRLAVLQIRKKKETFTEKNLEDFELLPESIKHDIRGRYEMTIK